MSWLLKIVDGPMKGAEIALVNGFKVKVGSGDACDIVIADGALESVAFELDVAEAGVTLMKPTGEAKVLAPFEVAVFATTAVAVGPAEGKWKALVWPSPEAEAEPEAKPTEEPKAEAKPDEKASEAAKTEAAKDGKPAETPKKKRRGIGCLIWLIVLIVLGVALWWFWPRIVEKYPKAGEWKESAVTRVSSWSSGAWGWCKGLFGVKPDAPIAPQVDPVETLSSIAATHGLELTTRDGAPCLKGNVARRTERLAIRALALKAEPNVQFDLTDDESLCKSADELLFVVTEGTLKAVAATNRVVTLTGAVPTAEKLETAVRALAADVPAIERLVTTDVKVGGTIERKPDGTVVVAAARPAPAPAAPKVKAPPARSYPIAGILTTPYPCVVMSNGLRLTEGAQIGTAVIERIEADRLVLKDGRETVEWRP